MYTLISLLFISLISLSTQLRCYEGSKGFIKGEVTPDFVEQTCEEGMTHCFESFNYNQTQVTAQCQLRSSDQKMLDICKVGCVNHTDVQVVICCCDTDLCNVTPYNYTVPELPVTTVLPSTPEHGEVEQSTETPLGAMGSKVEIPVRRRKFAGRSN